MPLQLLKDAGLCVCEDVDLWGAISGIFFFQPHVTGILLGMWSLQIKEIKAWCSMAIISGPLFLRN